MPVIARGIENGRIDEPAVVLARPGELARSGKKRLVVRTW